MEPKKYPSADLEALRPLLFSISLTASLTVAVIAIEWKSPEAPSALDRAVQHHADEMLDIPVTEHLPPPPPRVHQPVVVEVPDEEEIEQIAVDLDLEMKESVEEFVPAPPVMDSIEKEATDDEIFLIVEAEAVYPGGDGEMLKFIAKNIVYPPQARRMSIEGRVFVKAVIEKDGHISTAEVLKGIGGGCDQEAIRVIKAMPPWQPARQRGRPVRSAVTFPITFRLF
jgi:protein TonB